MKHVIKKINNNVVLAKDEDGQEVVLVGKGLGFNKIPYDLNDESLIEHVFVNARNNKVYDAFKELPTEIILLSEKIISVGKVLISKELSSSLLLTLSDHLAYAVERVKDNIKFDTNLQLDLRNIYPDEYSIGKIAIQMVKDELGYELPKSEANAIALHFINAEYSFEGMSETYKLAKTIDDIMQIVNKYAPKSLNEDSIYYARFVTHIRYFVLRQRQGVNFPENSNAELKQMISGDEQVLMDCVEEIKKYIKDSYGWSCSKEEEIYLAIHLKYLFYYQN